MTMTDINYKLNGLTVLYVPKEIYKIPIFEFLRGSKDKEGLERVVVYWIKQVRNELQDSNQHTPEISL